MACPIVRPTSILLAIGGYRAGVRAGVSHVTTGHNSLRPTEEDRISAAVVVEIRRHVP
jgi:hypothetical protein